MGKRGVGEEGGWSGVRGEEGVPRLTLPQARTLTLTLTKAINGHNGAMANATEVIRTHWPRTVMLGKTISERLPKTVIDFVMETLVRPHREVFAINDLTEEILPAPGVLLWGWGKGGGGGREGGGGRGEEGGGRGEGDGEGG